MIDRSMRFLFLKFAFIGFLFGLSQPGEAKDFSSAHDLVPRPFPSLDEIISRSNLGGRRFNVLQLLSPSFRSLSRESQYRFLIQGGIHGNETLASHLVSWLARRYAKGVGALTLLPTKKLVIDFVPYANPYGAIRRSRYNAKGINLNRNFNVLWGISRENPGPKSFSEPETLAIQSLFKERRYTAAIDVHGYVPWIVAPSSPELLAKFQESQRITAAKVQRYQAWVDALSQETQELPGYLLKTAGALGDGGAFEDWAFWEEDVLAACLEIASPHRYKYPLLQAPSNERAAQVVDSFLDYEKRIARILEHAIAIESRHTLASQSP